MIDEKYEIVKHDIKSMIYEIRGKQVMLDSDVSNLYGYETKELNRNVKRNINRFPDNYCFQLTQEEYDFIRWKKCTLKNSRGQHKKYLPYVFTEYGITMLAGLLKSNKAVEVSLNIVNAFIEMRKFINTNRNIFERVITLENNINDKFIEYDNKFELIFNELQKEENFKQKIFFKGQIYDAYSLIVDIVKKAKQKIIIIDNYFDKSLLDLLSKKNTNVTVVIISKENKLSELDIQKFNKQYSNLKVKKSDNFHDRFIIIDNETLYHIGASLKDLGNKCFGISVIADKMYLESLLKEL